jgi:hypothetical protein
VLLQKEILETSGISWGAGTWALANNVEETGQKNSIGMKAN